MTSKVVDVPPESKCLEVFDTIDNSRAGQLSLLELEIAVREIWPKFSNQMALSTAKRMADMNGNGFIQRNEFSFFLRFLSFFQQLLAYL
mmetsp:Transcript_19415/g.29951  ORF Transcript_19415/g.29951 Transcript_19415/m.29951 type:complete len:89 (+) Transcript_19415:163-429(+)